MSTKQISSRDGMGFTTALLRLSREILGFVKFQRCISKLVKNDSVKLMYDRRVAQALPFLPLICRLPQCLIAKSMVQAERYKGHKTHKPGKSSIESNLHKIHRTQRPCEDTWAPTLFLSGFLDPNVIADSLRAPIVHWPGPCDQSLALSLLLKSNESLS